MIFNLIPTEPLEYQVYADWLEDQGVILTAAIRKGELPMDYPEEEDFDYGGPWHCGYGNGYGESRYYSPLDRLDPEGEAGVIYGDGHGFGSVADYLTWESGDTYGEY